jgi:hypothetical protein
MGDSLGELQILNPLGVRRDEFGVEKLGEILCRCPIAHFFGFELGPYGGQLPRVQPVAAAVRVFVDRDLSIETLKKWRIITTSATKC